jgi:hypothetical protein
VRLPRAKVGSASCLAPSRGGIICVVATREDDDDRRDEGDWTHPPEGEQEKSHESEETLSDDEMSGAQDD